MESNPKMPQFNQKYLSKNVKKNLKQAFIGKSSYSDDELEFSEYPFNCCQLKKFIENEEFLNCLRKELLEIELFEKNNDLYKFHQSADLKLSKAPYISSFRMFLYDVFREWLQDVTGITLETTMDLNCAHYNYTDALLCHDDMLSGRRIAYILYLVPIWEKSDGGFLELFDINENGDPTVVVKSLLPQWNNFAFFEVSDKSFHRVSEVFSENRTRLSISGWFHGDPIISEDSPPPPKISHLFPAMHSEGSLHDWINTSYLDTEAQLEIRKKFQDDSEVELLEILNSERYEEVAKAIQDSKIEWEKIGPPNKRNFEVSSNSTLPPILKEFLELFRSEAMFLFLSNVTGLRLHKSAEVSDSSEDDDVDSDEPENVRKKQKLEESSNEGCGKCCCSLRRWKHGSYTLLHDGDSEFNGYALDVFLFLNCKGWSSKYGGYISYIAKDEDEELLSIKPQENALALVFRDKETLRFVKHINHKSLTLEEEFGYFSLFGVYIE